MRYARMYADFHAPLSALPAALWLTIALCAASCSPKVMTVQTHTADTLRVERIVRDTLVVTKPDSAMLTAMVECDSLGRAHLREIDQLHGERTQLLARLSQTDRGATLRVQAYAPPETLYVERIVEREVQHTSSEHTSAIGTPPSRGQPIEGAISIAAALMAAIVLGYITGRIAAKRRLNRF